MKNKLLLILALLAIVCLSAGVLVACNTRADDDSKVDFAEGDYIIDNKDVEYTVTPVGDSYTYTGKLYKINYLVKDGSKSYIMLSGEKLNEMAIVGYKGEVKSLSVSDIEKGVKVNKKPISINAIADNAFYGCTSLTSADLTKSNMSLAFTVGKNAFSRCTELETVTLPDKIYTVGNSIGEHAFSYCPSLTSVTVTDSFNDLGAYAFYGCTSLPSITLPDSIKVIKNSTFAKCSELETFSGATKLQSIQESAFEETAISDFNLAQYDKLVYIGNRAFRSTEFTSVTVPDSVTYIGTQAFYNLRELRSVTLPYMGNTVSGNGWTFRSEFGTISDNLMKDRSVKVTIKVAAQIPANAFANCVDISSLTINALAEDDTYTIYDADGVSFSTIDVVSSTEVGTRAFANCENMTSATLPEGITEIGSYAFDGCVALKNTTFPQSLETIGSYAYRDTALTTVTLQDNVESIGSEAFENCRLTEISLNRNLKEIGYRAFFGCANLTSFTVPERATKIGREILGDCVSLESLTIDSYNYIDRPTVSDGDDDDDDYTTTNATFAYKPLSSMFSSYTEYDYLTNRLYAAQYSASTSAYVYLPCSLTTVTLNGVDRVAASAFRGWEQLENVELNFVDEEMYIGFDTYPISICDYAFYDCKNLETLTLTNGDNVVKIGSRAFENCEKFDADELVKFDGLKEISYRAFANSGLTGSVTLPDTLAAIGTEIFYDCNGITSLTFEDYDYTFNNSYSVDFTTYNGIIAALFGTSLTNSHDIQTYYVSVSSGSGSTYLVPKSLIEISLLDTTSVPAYALNNMSCIETLTISSDTSSTQTTVAQTSLRGLTSLTTLNYNIPSKYLTDYSYCGILNGATNLAAVNLSLSTSYSSTSYYLATLFTTSGLASSNSSLPASLKTVNLIAPNSSSYYSNAYVPARLLYNASRVNEITFENAGKIVSIGENAFTNTAILRTIHTLEVVTVTPAEDGESEPETTTTTYTTYTYNGWILSATGENNAYYIPDGVVGVVDGALQTFDTLYTNLSVSELNDIKSLSVNDEEIVVAIEEGWTATSEDEEPTDTFEVITQNDSTYPFTVTTSGGTVYSITSTNKVSNSTSTYRITAVGNGTISFNYTASSESGCDRLIVTHYSSTGTIIGTVLTKSGTDYGSTSYEMSDGDYLTIVYSKDGSIDRNDDCIYITNITITAAQ
ncbi:MAG: leucine-rich repeat domain-containing protein [Corallococcus sp.]|nr:leucine-rich repeat domain-containing protein [Corallococcus sp.]